MALAGLRVLELEGIGPGPFAACILADFGADVVTISRAVGGKVHSENDPVSRGKRSVAIDLKSVEGVETLKFLAAGADIFIEPFRPGVAERLGLGPNVLCALNPRLIYGRMTGFGQGGTAFEKMAGHDANYLALSGVLDAFRRGKERPFPPANFAGDYAGGGVMLAMGVLLSVIERARSGKGQVIDAAMVDGAAYVAMPIFQALRKGRILRPTEHGHFDVETSDVTQGAFWGECYECKEDPAKPGLKQYMAVQAPEPAFYRALLRGLGLENAKGLPYRRDRSSWPWMKERFASIFRTKTRDEWAAVFEGTDACCVPVLSPVEAPKHPHNLARGTFAPSAAFPGEWEPAPAPKLSRTPGAAPRVSPTPGSDTRAVLAEYGIPPGRIEELLGRGAVVDALASRL